MIGPFQFKEATVPVLISIPHNGSLIPAGLASQMTEIGRTSTDTDWFLDRLYDFAGGLGAGVLCASYSRYVIDLNRGLSDESLYPGQTTTGLFPTTTFDGEPLFCSDRLDAEKESRIDQIWQPYHACLQDELRRMREQFGSVVLFDAHSIASRVPRLFDGQLPDLNFGTNHGATCDSSLSDTLRRTVEPAGAYSHVFNGRFVGGHITRQYGNPTSGIHSVQLELSQATYLNEADKTWSAEKAQRVCVVLRSVVEAIVKWVQS